MVRFDPDERPDDTTLDMVDRLARLGTGMSADDVATFDPPPTVWAGIVAQLEADRAPRPVVIAPSEAPSADADVVPLAGRRRNWTVPASIAAAVVVIGGVIGGFALSGDDEPTTVELASAPLDTLQPVVPVPDAASAAATAKLVREGDGRVHVELVDATMPAVPAGYHYEIWLIDTAVTDPHSLSGGSMGGRTDFVVPPDVDPTDHPIVDVSVEPDDGDPGHAGVDHSILRGRLAL